MKKIYAIMGLFLLTACGGGNNGDYAADGAYYSNSTPTVDYIEGLDVYTSEHRDSFLNMLAMNYRSYAIYNARTSGFPDIGERFAQKAVAAFSGEVPFPENVDDWGITDGRLKMNLEDGYLELMDALRNDGSELFPEIAAEAQAKFDCWVSSSASCQNGTAEECRVRFENALAALKANMAAGGDSSKIVRISTTSNTETGRRTEQARQMKTYYPATTDLRSATAANRTREGVVIVNNVNIPENLINPVPVQPLVFNQNIISNGKEAVMQEPAPVVVVEETREKSCPCTTAACDCAPPVQVIEEKIIPVITDDLVTREEFIEAMLALRAELAAINKRLDGLQTGETTILKVQQIPLEPKQHIMEEIFEVRFDFNKSNIKPEYEALIKKLVDTTRSNKNVKISVIGHTDTKGSQAYNFALGGRRAEAVRQMLIKYGIPQAQIVAVSSGEKDLKVPTGDNVANAENRRVRVVKEEHFTEPAAMPAETTIHINETDFNEYGMPGTTKVRINEGVAYVTDSGTVVQERVMGFPVSGEGGHYTMPRPLSNGN